MNGIKISLIAALCVANSFAEVIMLDEATVTTTAFGQKQAITDVQASVQVLDQKVIKSTSGRTVAQVLNEAVGVDIKDGGGSTEISIRGFEDTQTLILVDGLRRTGKYGNSDVGAISMEDIERIEIVRGPMSALYGADAMAGVVNIITKEAAKGTTAKVSVIGGMAQNHDRKTGIVRASVNVGGEKVSHMITAEARERGDYRVDENSIATDLREESHKFVSYANTIKFGQDTLKTRLEFHDQDDNGVYRREWSPYAPALTADTYEKEKRYQIAAIYNHVAEDYTLNTNLGYGHTDSDIERSGAAMETTKYDQTEGNAFLHHYTSDNMVNIIGIGGRHEDIDVTINSQKAYRTNFNALYQNEWSITENLSTVVGIRYDDYSDFGDTINPRASAKYDLENNLFFRASYGEAYKAPSFTNLYGYFQRGGGYIIGNPNLDAEESKTYELATGYAISNLKIDLVYHHTKIDNLIDAVPVTASSDYLYTNIDKATREGVELSATYHPINEFGINASLAYLDSKDDTTGERLTNSARYTTKVRLSYEQENTNYFLNFKSLRDYYGETAVRSGEYKDYDYHTVDVKVTHAWNETLEFSAGIDNIQNKKPVYSMTLFGLPDDPGERYYYVGVTAKF